MTTKNSLQSTIKIKNIVFDFGRVLVNWDPCAALQNLYPDRDHSSLAKELFADEWNLLDQGVITEQRALELLSAKTGLSRPSIRQVLSLLEDTVTPIQPMIDLVFEIKQKGFGVYLLSNMSLHDFKQREGRFEFFLKTFDGIVYSADVKLIKPDPKIYEEFFLRFNLVPQECIFIDDRTENLVPAAKLGMRGIQFKGVAGFTEFKRELEGLVGVRLM